MLVDFAVAARATPKSDLQLRGEALQLEARRHHDVWDRLSNIVAPTLVTCGEFDALAPPANSEAILSRVAGARLERFQGGHMFMFQDRVAMPCLLDFLAAD
jgi:pimeloyl-ACP methyl ester carboxylesterase